MYKIAASRLCGCYCRWPGRLLSRALAQRVSVVSRAKCPVTTRAMSAATEAVTQQGSLLSLNGDATETKAEQSFEQIVAEKKAYYEKRVKLFEGYKAKYDAEIEAAKAAAVPITVTLPSGDKKSGIKGVTTSLDIASSISNSLAKRVLVAKVDGKTYDLFRPLQGDCNIELKTFDDPEGKDTFWHSSSHVLGQSLELEFGADLTIGPSIDEGFYYDCYLGEKTLTEADKARVEKRFQQAVKEKQSFQRIEVTREEALGMFEENKFKVEIISGLPQDAVITVYRVGPMVDLCTGPHLPNTQLLKAFTVHNMSRAHWRADVTKEPLQRVYGVTFPDDKQMKEYQHRMEEARKRDHRNVGTKQELFFFNALSPGSCFFLPNGGRIYSAMIEFIREKYWEYEFEEVVTPNMFNLDLWKVSGHADHYKQNMFLLDVEKQEFGLKPMNCPGHCVLFGNRVRSYRELPLRIADFGVLHRNEFSGALHGLTRVRRFQQDDAHIFCRPDQVMDEVSKCLRMTEECYGVFGLDFDLTLSTRPTEGSLGTDAMWQKAEANLTEALQATGRPWTINPGDGAFYGPKIDIYATDSLRRKIQCATIQLDFNLPQRFKLQYTANEGFETPVMIHRAVLGSVERMFAILTEHYGGKWPFWLSPRQAMIVPVAETHLPYAQEVRAALRKARLHVDVDDSSKTLNKKIREAQLEQYNYVLVVGDKEAAERSVNVRTRDNVVHGMHSLDSVVDTLARERATRSLGSAFTKQEAPREPATAA